MVGWMGSIATLYYIIYVSYLLMYQWILPYMLPTSVVVTYVSVCIIRGYSGRRYPMVSDILCFQNISLISPLYTIFILDVRKIYGCQWYNNSRGFSIPTWFLFHQLLIHYIILVIPSIYCFYYSVWSVYM